jgi:DNA-binding transcriptional regulator LsrR (DeoR family)
MLSEYIRRKIVEDAKEMYFKGKITQKELAKKYNVSTVRDYIDIALKELKEESRISKIKDSEFEVVKYGIPKTDRFYKK